jgi:hypothetical protein
MSPIGPHPSISSPPVPGKIPAKANVIRSVVRIVRFGSRPAYRSLPTANPLCGPKRSKRGRTSGLRRVAVVVRPGSEGQSLAYKASKLAGVPGPMDRDGKRLGVVLPPSASLLAQEIIARVMCDPLSGQFQDVMAWPHWPAMAHDAHVVCDVIAGSVFASYGSDEADELSRASGHGDTPPLSRVRWLADIFTSLARNDEQLSILRQTGLSAEDIIPQRHAPSLGAMLVVPRIDGAVK